MVNWHATGWKAKYAAGGIALALEVERDPKLPGAYWKVTDEEGKTVRSGVRDTMGQAKASATRSAKVYCQTARGVL